MRFAFVHAHRDTWPVAAMCRALGVTAAGYYARRSRPVGPRAVRRAAFAAQVRAAFADHREVFGSPRLTRALNGSGVACCENTVATVRRAEGLSAVRRRRVRPP